MNIAQAAVGPTCTRTPYNSTLMPLTEGKVHVPLAVPLPAEKGAELPLIPRCCLVLIM